MINVDSLYDPMATAAAAKTKIVAVANAASVEATTAATPAKKV